MEKDVIFEKVRQIIVKQLGVTEDEVKLESNFDDDLAADSLDTVELVMALEEQFKIDIPDEASQEIKTVDDAVESIAVRLKGGE